MLPRGCRAGSVRGAERAIAKRCAVGEGGTAPTRRVGRRSTATGKGGPARYRRRRGTGRPGSPTRRARRAVRRAVGGGLRLAACASREAAPGHGTEPPGGQRRRVAAWLERPTPLGASGGRQAARDGGRDGATVAAAARKAPGMRVGGRCAAIQPGRASAAGVSRCLAPRAGAPPAARRWRLLSASLALDEQEDGEAEATGGEERR